MLYCRKQIKKALTCECTFSLQDGTNNDQCRKSHMLKIILKVTQHIRRVGNSERMAQPKLH